MASHPLDTNASTLSVGCPAPQFSPDMKAVACADTVYSWPERRRIVEIEGPPAGWGVVWGVDYLLVQSGSGPRIVSTGGVSHPIPSTDFSDLEWSPDGKSVWLTFRSSGTLRLESWTPTAGMHQLASGAVAGETYSKIAVSPSGTWTVIWDFVCGSPGCVTKAAAGRTGTQLRPFKSTLTGTLESLRVADDGSVLASGRGSEAWLAVAQPGQDLSVVATGRDIWPGPAGTFVEADASSLINIDPRTLRRTAVPLPADVDTSDVVGISPDLKWLATWDAPRQLTQFRSLTGAQKLVASTPSSEAPSLVWPPTSSAALVLTGPPAGAFMVDLSSRSPTLEPTSTATASATATSSPTQSHRPPTDPSAFAGDPRLHWCMAPDPDQRDLRVLEIVGFEHASDYQKRLPNLGYAARLENKDSVLVVVYDGASPYDLVYERVPRHTPSPGTYDICIGTAKWHQRFVNVPIDWAALEGGQG